VRIIILIALALSGCAANRTAQIDVSHLTRAQKDYLMRPSDWRPTVLDSTHYRLDVHNSDPPYQPIPPADPYINVNIWPY
jgi:hypothetical protein